MIQKIYLMGPDSKWDDYIRAFTSPGKAVDFLNSYIAPIAKADGEKCTFSLGKAFGDNARIISSNPQNYEGYYLRIIEVDTGKGI